MLETTRLDDIKYDKILPHTYTFKSLFTFTLEYFKPKTHTYFQVCKKKRRFHSYYVSIRLFLYTQSVFSQYSSFIFFVQPFQLNDGSINENDSHYISGQSTMLDDKGGNTNTGF